ncbi:hypothetical protein [Nocardia jiangsuensis]|uniref:RiboL-PSP-HEPN domain-containing protein n=1 Tax=Nocardia jiangsuensis TaxID=1691563 RepID=A0ABV8E1J8_9NOCA
MPSPLFVALQNNLNNLKSSLIAPKKSDFSKYTSAEHDMALGFVLLASAHVEEYAEQRCLKAASAAMDSHGHGKATRASKCLLVWHAANFPAEMIPLEPAEFASSLRAADVLKQYRALVNKMHGISGTKLLKLVVPLGLRDSELDIALFNTLNDLADRRNRAAHVRVNRAKLMKEPVEEWNLFQQILKPLETMDISIDAALRT